MIELKYTKIYSSTPIIEKLVGDGTIAFTVNRNAVNDAIKKHFRPKTSGALFKGLSSYHTSRGNAIQIHIDDKNSEVVTLMLRLSKNKNILNIFVNESNNEISHLITLNVEQPVDLKNNIFFQFCKTRYLIHPCNTH